MSTAPAMQRPQAIEIAKSFVQLLEGTYDELKVAGSLRRRLGIAHDIEVVAVPKIEQHSAGLFEGMTTDVDLLDARMTALLDNDEVSKRLDARGSPRWGQRLKYLTYRGARIDLFCPEAGQFGWHLVLRTGPAIFSRQLVVPKTLDNGRRGMTKDRRPGLMPPHLVAEGGWLRYRTSREPIPTPTEQSVFDLFNIPYIEPAERV